MLVMKISQSRSGALIAHTQQFNTPIVTGCGQPIRVTTEKDRINSFSTPNECIYQSHHIVSLETPQLERAVRGAAGKPLTIWADRERCNRARASTKHLCGPPDV